MKSNNNNNNNNNNENTESQKLLVVRSDGPCLCKVHIYCAWDAAYLVAYESRFVQPGDRQMFSYDSPFQFDVFQVESDNNNDNNNNNNNNKNNKNKHNSVALKRPPLLEVRPVTEEHKHMLVVVRSPSEVECQPRPPDDPEMRREVRIVKRVSLAREARSWTSGGPNPYATLELSQEELWRLDEDEQAQRIKQSFHRLIRIFHADRAVAAGWAEEDSEYRNRCARDIIEAYNVLCNRDKKREVDRRLKSASFLQWSYWSLLCSDMYNADGSWIGQVVLSAIICAVGLGLTFVTAGAGSGVVLWGAAAGGAFGAGGLTLRRNLRLEGRLEGKSLEEYASTAALGAVLGGLAGAAGSGAQVVLIGVGNAAAPTTATVTGVAAISGGATGLLFTPAEDYIDNSKLFERLTGWQTFCRLAYGALTGGAIGAAVGAAGGAVAGTMLHGSSTVDATAQMLAQARDLAAEGTVAAAKLGTRVAAKSLQGLAGAAADGVVRGAIEGVEGRLDNTKEHGPLATAALEHVAQTAISAGVNAVVGASTGAASVLLEEFSTKVKSKPSGRQAAAEEPQGQPQPEAGSASSLQLEAPTTSSPETVTVTVTVTAQPQGPPEASGALSSKLAQDAILQSAPAPAPAQPLNPLEARSSQSQQPLQPLQPLQPAQEAMPQPATARPVAPPEVGSAGGLQLLQERIPQPATAQTFALPEAGSARGSQIIQEAVPRPATAGNTQTLQPVQEAIPQPATAQTFDLPEASNARGLTSLAEETSAQERPDARVGQCLPMPSQPLTTATQQPQSPLLTSTSTSTSSAGGEGQHGEEGACAQVFYRAGWWNAQHIRMVVEYQQGSHRWQDWRDQPMEKVSIPLSARFVKIYFANGVDISSQCLQAWDRRRNEWMNHRQLFRYRVPQSRSFTIEGVFGYQAVVQVLDEAMNPTDDGLRIF